MHSVRGKIAMSMFLLSMLAMAVVLLTVHRSSLNALRDNEIHYNVESTGQTKYTFSYLFDSVYKTARLLAGNTDINAALYADTPQDEAEIARMQDHLSEMLETVIYPTEAITAVHIIGDADWKFFTSAPMVDEAQVRKPVGRRWRAGLRGDRTISPT